MGPVPFQRTIYTLYIASFKSVQSLCATSIQSSLAVYIVSNNNKKWSYFILLSLDMDVIEKT